MKDDDVLTPGQQLLANCCSISVSNRCV